MEFKKIGILGGMGPAASAACYQEIISYCQNKFNAIQDTDYPSIILYSLPLQGFDESGVVDKKIVLEQLLIGIKTLEQAGCECIAIPCNSVHIFINELRQNTSVPIISIIEQTVKQVKNDQHSFVGLLASQTTLNSELYQPHFKKNCISYCTPLKSEHPAITKVISEVMSGNIKTQSKQAVLSIIDKMQQQKISAIVLGCTELPLAIEKQDTQIKIYNTIKILAHAIVNKAVKSNKRKNKEIKKIIS